MADEELSKRIDDVHRRLDDLRADGLQLRQEMTAGFAQLRQEMGQLRQEMTAGFAQLRQEMGQLRQEMGQLREDMTAGFAQLRQEMGQLRQETDRRIGQLFWQMNIWFALLALLMTAYRFLW